MEKDPTEYTGIESEIALKIRQENNDWFPINRAFCLQDQENDETSQSELIINKVNNAKNKLESLKESQKVQQEQLQENLENASVDYHGSNFYESQDPDNSILMKAFN